MKKELQQKIDAPYSKNSVQQSLYGVLLQKKKFSPGGEGPPGGGEKCKVIR